MKVKVVSEDVSVGENGVKVQNVQKYSLTCQKFKLHKKCLWAKRSCWGRGINFELVAKA